MAKKVDVGLAWGKYLTIWGQFASIWSFCQTIMIIVMFYVTSISSLIVWWGYIIVLSIPVILAIEFIRRWGMVGNFRFFNQQTAVGRTERLTRAIARQIGMSDEEIQKVINGE